MRENTVSYLPSCYETVFMVVLFDIYSNLQKVPEDCADISVEANCSYSMAKDSVTKHNVRNKGEGCRRSSGARLNGSKPFIHAISCNVLYTLFCPLLTVAEYGKKAFLVYCVV